MAEETIKHPGRVSVVIPCYNHGRFLPVAINSVLQQHYDNTEIIIVDDGSTDNTKDTVKMFPNVKYVHQVNQGLSAARNSGIIHSTGEFLVFLDADDWLEKDAFLTNLNALNTAPDAAFVSGAHIKVSPSGMVVEDVRNEVRSAHYLHLLQGNYIGMHGTVMYRRWIFDHFKYDTTLKACEDYDLYLKIARRFPVIHHTHRIASYLIHGTNMSSDASMMLEHVLAVLDRQEAVIDGAEEKRALENGRKIWKEYYSTTKGKKRTHMNRRRIKKYLPDGILRMLFAAGVLKEYVPKQGHIRKGDFMRVKPFSTEFGYDRGGPVDRYYIERFLANNAGAVHGRVLEIGDNEYTLKYGAGNLSQTDILHIDDQNKKATIIGDLSNAPQIMDNHYDCIILTQTLHLIYDFQAALKTCFRILKPGGTLLMTVPGITHIDQGQWQDNWLWAFTGGSISRLLNGIFIKENVTVETNGNVFVAAAFLYGMGLSEMRKQDMDYNDPHYQVIISAKAVKPL